MSSVCAIVITRNRKALLMECIRGLLAQSHPVERVLVIDNASTDGTEELLRGQGLVDRPEVTLHRLERNSGGAGGYAEGVKLGRESGADWLWLMDDDAEPRPDALERLLAAPAAEDNSTAALCPAVVHPDGTIDPLHRGHVRRFMRPLPAAAYSEDEPSLGFASFVGFMVRTDVARAIDPPRAEFFLGCDDVEYSIRVRRHGRIRLVPGSALVHKHGVANGSVTRRSRLWNRVLGQSYGSASWEGFWKNLCIIRNFMWIKHTYWRIGPLAFAGITATYVLKSILYDSRPLRRVPWIVRYAKRGRLGDFSGCPPEEWAAIAAAMRG